MAECPGTFRLSATRDGALARLRVPGGQLSAKQLRTIATLSRQLGNGLIDLTNRANLQIRGLAGADGPKLIEALRNAELLTPTPSSDRHRNITASPLAGLDPTEIIDVTPHVRQLDEGLQNASWVNHLSPKFCFVLDGGGDFGLTTVLHDLGFLAEQGEQAPHYRLSFAGNISNWCVSLENAVKLALHLAAYAASQDISESGRIATLVTCLGIEGLLEKASADLATPYHFQRHIPPANGTKHIPSPGPLPQRQSGLISYALGVPLQRLTAKTCEALATLAEQYGDGSLRLSPWLSVIIPNIKQDRADEIRIQARQAGFQTDPEEGRLRIIACAGASGCDRAKLDTKKDGETLLRQIPQTIGNSEDVFTIHLSACARGCSLSTPADILLLARADGTGYEAYADSPASQPIAQNKLMTSLRPPDLPGFVENQMRQR